MELKLSHDFAQETVPAAFEMSTKFDIRDRGAVKEDNAPVVVRLCIVYNNNNPLSILGMRQIKQMTLEHEKNKSRKIKYELEYHEVSRFNTLSQKNNINYDGVVFIHTVPKSEDIIVIRAIRQHGEISVHVVSDSYTWKQCPKFKKAFDQCSGSKGVYFYKVDSTDDNFYDVFYKNTKLDLMKDSNKYDIDMLIRYMAQDLLISEPMKLPYMTLTGEYRRVPALIDEIFDNAEPAFKSRHYDVTDVIDRISDSKKLVSRNGRYCYIDESRCSKGFVVNAPHHRHLELIRIISLSHDIAVVYEDLSNKRVWTIRCKDPLPVSKSSVTLQDKKVISCDYSAGLWFITTEL